MEFHLPGGSRNCQVLSLSMINSIAIIALLSCFLLRANGIDANETDRLALLQFKASIIDRDGALSSWNASLHFCQWSGVTCGRRHQRVTVLNLKSKKLSGTISPHVGNLSFLRVLDLQNNSLHSGIPPEVGRYLSRLQDLFLNNNSLGGVVPPSLSNCSNLVTLSLGENVLHGDLPANLSSLSKLRELSLRRNNLTGLIPDSFGNLSSLEVFRATENYLGGRIPDTLGNLRNMQTLGLGGNNFVGTLPPSIFNISSIEALEVSHNELVGNLPWDLGFTLPKIQVLLMSGNQFTGSIPKSLSNMSDLYRFQILANNFSGDVPSLQKMSKLSYFTIANNSLGIGRDGDLNFLCSLTNSTLLEILNIGGNNFGRQIPECISNLSTTLRILSLIDNNIVGSLPSNIANLIGLESFLVRGNSISGTIPFEIGKLGNLKQLSFADNKLSGPIPHTIGNLTMLTRLALWSNSFLGKIPSSLSDCQDLILLDIADNELSGAIPAEVFVGLSSISFYVDFSQNNFTGELPLEIGNLKNLGALHLYDNKFSGGIPSSLGSCVMLEYLSLDDNMFEGSIPSTLSSLKGIRELNFSSNRLSGRIPKFLEDLHLESLDLSFNEFEGALPTRGIFQNASAVSVVGNQRLCGGPPEFELPKCDVGKPGKTRSNSRIRNITICSVSGFLGIALIIFGVYFFWSRKEKKDTDPHNNPKDGLLKVSYMNILRATDGFSSSNLIGVGSFGCVYRGVLNENQMPVAIKVLNLISHGASKSFIAECEALRNIRHRNLVKVLTACSGSDYQGNEFKALVYEFMVNGSLDEWLHPVDETSERKLGPSRSLSLLQRLNIAVDVACALDYLHHQCELPVIHCDLKPGNILLDSEMVGHVSDFGLSRFLPEATPKLIAAQSSSLGIKGSFGYIAPEYGAGGEVSTHGDVYSYGILVLEMFTGKRPTDEMFIDRMDIRSFVKAGLPKQVSQVLDPVLLQGSQEIQESLASIMEIGVVCSSESPRDRMNIADAAAALMAIRRSLLETVLAY